MNKSEKIAIKFLVKSIRHVLYECNNESCDWYWSTVNELNAMGVSTKPSQLKEFMEDVALKLPRQEYNELCNTF